VFVLYIQTQGNVQRKPSVLSHTLGTTLVIEVVIYIYSLWDPPSLLSSRYQGLFPWG